MPNMVPMHSLMMARPTGQTDDKGKPILKGFIPPIGESFDFTDKEIADLLASDPDCLRPAVNESPRYARPSADLLSVAQPADTVAASPAPAAPAKTRGKKAEPDPVSEDDETL